MAEMVAAPAGEHPDDASLDAMRHRLRCGPEETAYWCAGDCADDALARAACPQRCDDDDGYQGEHHHQFAEPATRLGGVISVEHFGLVTLNSVGYRAGTLKTV
jgi:hypothetical protein